MLQMRCLGQGEVLDLGLRAIKEGTSQPCSLHRRVRHGSYQASVPFSNIRLVSFNTSVFH